MCVETSTSPFPLPQVHARLPLAAFTSLCALADDFAADVAHLSGRGCEAVSAEAAAQAKAFVDVLLLIHHFLTAVEE